VAAHALRLRGRVQGVGLRPAVVRLARRIGVTGEVGNDGDGVWLHLYGTQEAVDTFLEALPAALPEATRIDAREVTALVDGPAPAAFTVAPTAATAVHTELAPDRALCPACLDELRDPGDRRHRWALNQCAECGPRVTLARALPWRREATSQAPFPPCDACRSEYADPEDRRFHAEPIACPDCGPRFRLREADGRAASSPEALADPVAAAAARLATGAIVAAKGTGGYHLLCDATDPAAIERLRLRKRRPRKPVAVLFADLAAVEAECRVSPEERAALASAAAPIVVLRRREGGTLPEGLAPGLRQLGCMLAHTALQHRLLAAVGRPLVATSGNRSGAPPCIDEESALRELVGIADAFLDHPRAITVRLDDSVVRFAGPRPVLLRRARGYFPESLPLPPGLVAQPPLLALGGDLKAAVCVAAGDRLVPGPHVGDLAAPAVRDDFERLLAFQTRLLGVSVQDVAVDLHPDYASRALARPAAEGTVHAVAHHHAHVAACLADAGRPVDAPPVLGIALDGLGYGADGTLCGGEFLLADYARCVPLGGLAAVALPGGEAAQREPWRNLLAQLLRCFPLEALDDAVRGTPAAAALAGRPVTALARVVADGTHAPLASSAGRLFDAVAAALGVAPERLSFEGEAALQLEDLAARAPEPAVPDGDLAFALRPEGARLRLDPAPLWPALLAALRRGAPPTQLARRFHRAFAEGLAAAAVRLRTTHRFDTVALGGGVFQNARLLTDTAEAMERSGLAVLVPRRLPPGDGGLAAGQAVVALARRSRQHREESERAGAAGARSGRRTSSCVSASPDGSSPSRTLNA
jgi:hydrogenase maturation protein HypF